MSKLESSLLDRELAATVRLGIFKSRAEGLQEALATLFASKPQYRLAAALEMYRSGEVTLSRAAEIAGLSSVRFRDVWGQRNGPLEIEIDAADLSAQAKRIARHRR
jgi:predicted HTH domain antitoxin